MRWRGSKFIGTRKGKYFPGRYKSYSRNQINELEEFLRRFKGIIIGHHIFAFDYRVLGSMISLEEIIEKTVDTLVFVYKRRDEKLKGASLRRLAELNLKGRKTILEAPISTLWAAGKRKEVIKYNANDCILTKGIWWKLVNERRLLYQDGSYQRMLKITQRDFLQLTGHRPQYTHRTWVKKIEDGSITLPVARPSYLIDGDMSDYIPFERCLRCRSKRLEKINPFKMDGYADRMSEAEIAEHIRGANGAVHCLNCGRLFFYDEDELWTV